MLEELRQLTRDSIEEGRKIKEDEEAHLAEQDRLATLQNKLWAEGILLTVPGKCKAAAAKGESSCVIITSRDDGIYSVDQYEKDCAKGNPKALKYKTLVELIEKVTELEVIVGWGHDGVGIQSWIIIEAHWG